MKTLVDLLRNSASQFPNDVALAVRAGLRQDEWTYSRLERAANAIAAYFRTELGLVPGDRVVVWAPNSPQVVAVYFGAFLARAVVVPLDPTSTGSFVTRVIRETEASAVITAFPPSEDLQAEMTHQLHDLPFESGAAVPGGKLPSEGDVAVIVFTSGTTGHPKGVILTHGNIVASIRSASQLLPKRQYRLLSLLPLSHMLEQSVGLYVPMLFGSRITYVASRHPRAIAEAMLRNSVTAMILVPQVLELMLRNIEVEVDRSGKRGQWQRAHQLAPRMPMSLRRILFKDVLGRLGGKLDLVISGGAHLPIEVAEAWERMGVRVVAGYGMTECAPIIACNTYWKRLHDSVGRPAPGVQIRISPDGEVLARGPNVTPGYWKNSPATEAAFTGDGWFRTGDLGTQDRDGNLRLEGRLKDLIVLSNGMKVHPEDVEAELLKEEAIADCIIVSMPGPRDRAEVHAVIIPRERDAEPAAAAKALGDAVRQANGRLASHQHISSFTAWSDEDFPRTNLLKVKRQEVIATVADARTGISAPPPGAKPPATGDPLACMLAGFMKEKAPDAIRDTSRLADLGLDSIGRVELALVVESELGIILDDEMVAMAETVGDLRELLDRDSNPAPAGAARWPLSMPARITREVLQRTLVFPVHALFSRPFTVRGRKNLRGVSGPVLFVSNHSSHMDTPSILRALPARLRRQTAVAAAADYFYGSRAAGAATSLAFNTFPFARTGSLRPTFDFCGELVDKGWSILVFPAGTRSKSGGMEPFRPGLELLSRELRIPVVPVGVTGTFSVLPKGVRWPKRGRVTVHFGVPVTPSSHGANVASASVEQAVRELIQTDDGEPTAATRRSRT